MCNVFDAAVFFIRTSSQMEDGFMTNTKLNNLLFFAQGVHLFRTGHTLFNCKIEAREIGAIVPEVYTVYEEYGENIIRDETPLGTNCFTEEEKETLLDVMREVGKYTESYILGIVKSFDSPWSKAIENGSRVIDITDMKRYFSENPVRRFPEKLNIERVDTFPADWYDLYEDEELEAYLK